MTTRQVDYIIIGQGLCGSFLSYYLHSAGKKVLVIDEQKPFAASKIASGIINPVTGRRIVRTWRIEELLPFAHNAYNQIGNDLGVSLVKECAVLDFYPSLQMKEAFEKRLTEEPQYLHETDGEEWKESFNYYYGIGKVSPCLLVDINAFLVRWKEQLLQQNALSNETFNINDCEIDMDGVSYRGTEASAIIFCDGVCGADNPYFKNLPFALNKGEAIIASIPGLQANNIYKQGISIVPWKDNLFWIGSSYEWKFENDQPSAAFKEKILWQLKNWLKIPFEIVNHLAAVRPANVERRPFVGLHPVYNSVGILNGMGTKGCSLSPFFAKQFADLLTMQQPIYPDADVRRFEKVLARKVV